MTIDLITFTVNSMIVILKATKTTKLIASILNSMIISMIIIEIVE